MACLIVLLSYFKSALLNSISTISWIPSVTTRQKRSKHLLFVRNFHASNRRPFVYHSIDFAQIFRRFLSPQLSSMCCFLLRPEKSLYTSKFVLPTFKIFNFSILLWFQFSMLFMLVFVLIILYFLFKTDFINPELRFTYAFCFAISLRLKPSLDILACEDFCYILFSVCAQIVQRIKVE